MIETTDGRVLAEVTGLAWCARHWSEWVPGTSHCAVVTNGASEDPGRCIAQALYVEAPDP